MRQWHTSVFLIKPTLCASPDFLVFVKHLQIDDVGQYDEEETQDWSFQEFLAQAVAAVWVQLGVQV